MGTGRAIAMPGHLQLKMHAPAQEAADDKVSHWGPGAASVLGCDSDTWNKKILDGPV